MNYKQELEHLSSWVIEVLSEINYDLKVTGAIDSEDHPGLGTGYYKGKLMGLTLCKERIFDIANYLDREGIYQGCRFCKKE